MTASITSLQDRLGRRVGLDETMSSAAPNESSPDLSPQPPPIAVYSSFVVSPHEANVWIQTWKNVAHMAQTWPGCRSFRILRDRNDDMFMATISEWDDMAAYTKFIHETCNTWLQRSMGHMCMPSEARFLDVIPVESALHTG
ncbi:MAG TPA: antibiotic biosynthesis monooxygenase [Chloroflexota bacterium]